MKVNKVDLTKYRGNHSTLFSGRPQGEAARKDIGLDDVDKSATKTLLVIPTGTSSFNPSFYLGLLFDSIKKFGIEEFEKRYEFEIADSNPMTREALAENLADGKRSAINSLTGKSGIGRFIKR